MRLKRGLLAGLLVWAPYEDCRSTDEPSGIITGLQRSDLYFDFVGTRVRSLLVEAIQDTPLEEIEPEARYAFVEFKYDHSSTELL